VKIKMSLRTRNDDSAAVVCGYHIACLRLFVADSRHAQPPLYYFLVAKNNDKKSFLDFSKFVSFTA
jgi:hypothetical protein